MQPPRKKPRKPPPPETQESKITSAEILLPLPAPSAWQHAPHDEADEDDAREVFRSELPPDLQFTPVPRKTRRSNGFTPERQRAFILHLAACGSVTQAAKAIGTSRHAISKLRNAAGAESFDAAWTNAARRGAKRILDVMIENAVHGTPEYLYQNGQLIAERRRFSTRAQMWLVAHYLPDQFAVPGGLMHQRGSEVQMKWQKEQWRREWAQEQRALEPDVEAIKAEILTKIKAMERPRMMAIAQDPEKRAAWELLHGPVDWGEYGFGG